jgi:hypothetical protein
VIAYLKTLVHRLARRLPGPFLPPPEDPDVGVREPLKRGPGGRNSAVAVAEPRDQAFVGAVGAARDSAAISHNAPPHR